MKQRICAVCTIFCMVITLCTAVVNAETEINGDSVTITEMFGAETANERFTLTVYRTDVNLEGDVTAADVRYIAEVSAGADGKVVFTFPFKQTSGAYPYHVKGETGAAEKSAVLYYVNQKAYEEAVAELKEALQKPQAEKAVALQEVLTKHIDTLQLTKDFPIYQSIKNKDNRTAFDRLADSLKAEMTADELCHEFQNAILLCAIETADKTMVQEIIEDYRAVLGLTNETALDYYDSSLSVSAKLNIAEAISKNVYSTSPQLTKKVYEEIALAVLNEAVTWQKLSEALGELRELAEIETGKLYNLSKTEQNSALQSVVAKRPYASLSDFSSKLAAAIQTTANNSSGSFGGGGGGGSLGGGSGKASSVTMTPEVLEEVYGNDRAERFSDLENVVWAKEAILNLAERNVISGRGNGIFAPNDSVTREEFVKMLILALDFEVTDNRVDFTDTTPEMWYAPYVATAWEVGVTTGNGDGTFGVGMPISRQDAVVMLARAMEIRQISMNSVNESTVFTDENQISEYAKDAVYRLTGYGILNGVGDGSFAPVLNVTRAEAAKMLYAVRG